MPNPSLRSSIVLATALVCAGCSDRTAAPSGTSASAEASATPAEPAPAEDATAAGASKWPAEQLAAFRASYGDLQETPSGLLVRILQPGDGTTRARRGQQVLAHYTGKFLDGKVFDSSIPRGSPLQFAAGVKQVIPGWDEAILDMTKGEKRIIIVPPNLGYGSRGAGGGLIPPNAVLVFEMEFVDLAVARLPGT